MENNNIKESPTVEQVRTGERELCNFLENQNLIMYRTDELIEEETIKHDRNGGNRFDIDVLNEIKDGGYKYIIITVDNEMISVNNGTDIVSYFGNRCPESVKYADMENVVETTDTQKSRNYEAANAVATKLLEYMDISVQEQIEFLVEIGVEISELESNFNYTEKDIAEAWEKSETLNPAQTTYIPTHIPIYIPTKLSDREMKDVANLLMSRICETEKMKLKEQFDLLLNTLKIDREDVIKVLNYPEKLVSDFIKAQEANKENIVRN